MKPFAHVLFILPRRIIPMHASLINKTIKRLLPKANLTIVSEPHEVMPTMGVDLVVAPQVPWLDMLTELCPELRWLHLLTAGADVVAKTKLAKTVPWISKSSGVNSVAIAEYVIGGILYLFKSFPSLAQQQTERRWERCWLRELTGKRALVIGLGSVGGCIAERLCASAMDVWGVRRTSRPHPAVQRIVQHSELLDAMPYTDVLIVAAPLTPETAGLVSEQVLSRIRPGGILVDVSRGGIVPEKAVVNAINAKVLGGAVLDVFDTEPLPPESPLWTLPNVLVTPHVAGTSDCFMDNAMTIFEKNLLSLRRHRSLYTPFDAKVGY